MTDIEANPTVFCMTTTPFTSEDKVDYEAMRRHLRSIASAGCGVYLGSGGSGEGHALTLDELGKLYEVGVSELKGKVPVYANPREARTARQMLELCQIAAHAGVEVVQIYPLDGGHGMKPNPVEQEAYYRDILDQFDHPAALSIHPMAVGYVTPPALVERLAHDYPQIKAVNVMAGQAASVFVGFRERLGPEIKLYSSMATVMENMMQGASGCLATEPNFIPRLSRKVVTSFAKGDVKTAGETMTVLIKAGRILSPLGPGAARSTKSAMKALGVGNGILRRPYVEPAEAEQKRIASEFQALRLAELEAAA